MRTRFAPSPTGSLHIGGLRTALFSWLIAKKHGGTFFLRIEDTDRTREVEGASERFVHTLTWAGLAPDEGVTVDAAGHIAQKGEYGPYFQSERLPTYKTYADQLVEKGHAYPCFCTAERLDGMRERQMSMKQAPMYDRTCLHLAKDEVAARIAAGEAHVIRLLVPRTETISFVDEIYGKLEFKGAVIDDQVLIKSDGFPTYHLAHVVDDHLMKTDMVVRGEEWVSSLPKHLILFKAFGWAPPKFAHVPLLLNADRSKLSKRQNDVSTEHYIEKGYLKEALINFLALLGWNPGTEQDLFSLDELIAAFSIDRVQKSGAIFDLKKLDWLQGQWMRKIPPAEFVRRIETEVFARHPAAKKDSHFAAKAALVQERITFFAEAPEAFTYFYEEPTVAKELLMNEKQGVTAENLPKILALLTETLTAVDEKSWTIDGLKEILFKVAETHAMKKGQILWPLRAALTGQQFSPGAFEVASELGKAKTLERLGRVSA